MIAGQASEADRLRMKAVAESQAWGTMGLLACVLIVLVVIVPVVTLMLLAVSFHFQWEILGVLITLIALAFGRRVLSSGQRKKVDG
jgi:uncharacterized membrane protein YdjX (TVP38/TMEM64 family)